MRRPVRGRATDGSVEVDVGEGTMETPTNGGALSVGSAKGSTLSEGG